MDSDRVLQVFGVLFTRNGYYSQRLAGRWPSDSCPTDDSLWDEGIHRGDGVMGCGRPRGSDQGQTSGRAVREPFRRPEIRGKAIECAVSTAPLASTVGNTDRPTTTEGTKGPVAIAVIRGSLAACCSAACNRV